MSNPPTVAVIVVAAGSGSRLGRAEPKAFVPLGEGDVLSHAVDGVLGMRETPFVVLVVPSDRVDAVAARYARPAGMASVAIVAGGETRQASVAAGLAALPAGIEVVLVHDAARALTPSLVFDEVAAAVRTRGHGIVPALDVVDTVKRVDAARRVLETVDRAELAAVQTPQGFPRGGLERAYRLATVDYTDDAALVQAAGMTVEAVPGDARAFKITRPADLHRAEQLVAEAEAAAGSGAHVPLFSMRVGTGADVHAFSTDPATELWLAGLHWPGETGLAGHSDGDAACHAICDALLAACGLGDVGQVFGTSDPALDGAHGEVFLRETLRRVNAAGYAVGNVTVQIVGNRPKLAPRRAEAEALLSGVLGAPVSVAATTSDGLGFTGRGEGIAAIATALVHRR